MKQLQRQEEHQWAETKQQKQQEQQVEQGQKINKHSLRA